MVRSTLSAVRGSCCEESLLREALGTFGSRPAAAAVAEAVAVVVLLAFACLLAFALCLLLCALLCLLLLLSVGVVICFIGS